MRHLWEYDHPYYASESNFFSNDYTNHFDSWVEFEEAWGNNDLDLNLLIRWDWDIADPGDYEEGDDPSDTLQLTYVLQRKGIYVANFVKITEDDEPAVRAFLAPRWEHMKLNWEGIS